MRNEDSLATILLVSRLCAEGTQPLTVEEYWELRKQFENPSVLLGQTESELSQTHRLAPDLSARIVRLLDRATAMAFELEVLEQSGISTLTPFDDYYPKRFHEQLEKDKVPPLLHAAGNLDLLQAQGIGIVGSRDVSDDGADVAKRAAEEAVRLGYVLVSGGARGVDRLAMNAALEAGGSVVGVLAESLMRKLKAPDVRGAIHEGRTVMCTPYNPNAPFNVGNAMGRNKLIYALSHFTLVVASDVKKGGTWSGAEEALEKKLGRVGVWRGPGQGDGNEELIELKKGAVSISSIDEIEAALTDPETVAVEPEQAFKQSSLFEPGIQLLNSTEPSRPVRTYRDLRPTFADREGWTTARVLAHRAQSHGDAIYLDCPEEGRTWTYHEIFEAARRVASTLALSGGGPGERLLVMLPNSSIFIRTWLGSQVAGMVEVPINTSYRGQFLEHQVSTVQPKLAVIDGSYAERFVESKPACETIQRLWVAGTNATAAIATLREAGWEAEPWDTLEASEPAEPVEVSPRDLASIFFTSGTTGPSKGVMMPQAQMYFFADECVSLTRLTDADTYMVTTPLFHGNAQFLAAYPALVAGARFVLHSHFSASRWIDQIRDCGATVTNFLGVMMDFVWKQPPRPDDADNNLRCIFAAPTAYSIIHEFKTRFGVDAFVEVFGLTETSMPIMSPYGEDRPLGAAGLAVEDWFDVRLVDPETDEEVPTGELGELVIRTKYPWTCSLGYYNMADKTAEAWRNLWFHTGDGLRRDADGWYYFVDRLKDALRRRGENISSYEVEQALLGHPDITECAVVAVKADIEAGEDEVMAWLVTSGPIDVAELWAWADTRMPAFAVPRFIEVVEELPKTPSERVQKVKLRERGVSPTTHDRTNQS